MTNETQTENVVQLEAPDPFDIDTLLVSGEVFSEDETLTSVRVGKPSKDVPFRVHPDPHQTVIG